MDRQHRISELREIVRANPNDPENWLELGITLTQAGIYDEATVSLTKAYEIDPDQIEAGYWLAYTLNEIGNFDESLRVSSDLAARIGSPSAFYYMGYSLRELGRFDAALKAFEDGIQAGPDSRNHFGAATVYARQGLHRKAVDLMRQAREMEGGESPELLYTLAMSEIELGQKDRAVSSLERCLDLAPGHISAANELGLLYAQVNRISDALSLLNTILRYDTDNIMTINNLGYVYYLAGLYQKSEIFLKAALEQNPNYPNAHLGLGLVYEAMDNYSAAVAELEKFVAINPGSADGWASLVKAYMRKGDLPGARETLERALQRHPESTQLQELLSDLRASDS